MPNPQTRATTDIADHGYAAATKLCFEPVLVAKREALAKLRGLPPRPVGSFAFRTPEGTPITLADLFGTHDDLLLVHNMGQHCSYCTLWADGLIGLAPHIERRCALVLCSADEPAKLAETIAERGWTFRCVSGRGSGCNEALGFGTSERALPGVSSLRRRADGSVEQVAAAAFGPGDDFCPVWPFFDLLADGPNGWEPK
jgi:predicted dithiol-disulfide oxidoreductase (DUF899 family)